jgi:hypothetical protein
MRMLIVYYSRTGNTRKVSQELAAMLGADLAEVRCDLYPPGFFRHLLATYDSLKKKLPDIEFPSPTGRAALRPRPGRWAALGWPPGASDRRVPGHAQVAVRQNGSVPHPHQFTAQRASAKMEVLLAASAGGKLALRAKDIRGDRRAAALRPFAHSWRTRRPPPNA